MFGALRCCSPPPWNRVLPLLAVLLMLLPSAFLMAETPTPNMPPDRVQGRVETTAVVVGDYSYGHYHVVTAEGEGVDVAIFADTVIIDQNGSALAPDQVETGNFITAFGRFTPTLAPPTRLEARHIVVGEPDNAVVNIRGPIERISPSEMSIMVAYHHVLIKPDTIIRSEFTDEVVTYEDLNLRDLVHVKAVPSPVFVPDDTMVEADPSVLLPPLRLVTAVEVILIRRAGPDPVPFHGEIAGIDAEGKILAVNDVRIIVTNETALLSVHGPITFEEFSVGDMVTGFGVPTSGGIQAIEVMLMERHPPPLPVRVVGPVAQIDRDAGAIVVIEGEDMVRIAITNTTTFSTESGLRRTFADLRLGDHVTVAALPGPNGPLTAIYVVIGGGVQPSPTMPPTTATITPRPTPTPGNHVEFIAPIITIDADSRQFTAGGSRVLVSDTTVIETREGLRLEFDALRVGQLVEVRGIGLPAMGMLSMVEAHHIRVLEFVHPPTPTPIATPPPEEHVFVAPIRSIDAEAHRFMAGGYNVLVGDGTVIVSRDGAEMQFDDLAIDQVVEVSGQISMLTIHPPMLAARHIRVMEDVGPPPPPVARVLGLISGIDAEALSFTVRDLSILTTSDTVFEARAGVVLTFADLEVGQLVNVHGEFRSNSEVVAHRVRVQSENTVPGPPAVVAGFITALELPGSMTVGQQDVVLTEQTNFRYFDGSTMAPEGLEVGDRVRVILDRDAIVPAIWPPILVAATVDLRASAIEAIDLEERLLSIADLAVHVPEGTPILELRGEGRLTLEDLMVGDMVRVLIAHDLDVAQPQARLIVRVAVPEISGPVEGFSPVEPDHEDGAPGIVVTDPANTFGAIGLPQTLVDVEPNTLYDLRMRVSTNMAERLRVPTLRLRLNTTDGEKGGTFEVSATGEARHVPNAEGRWYRSLFVPPLTDADNPGQLYASLDLIAFGGRSRAGARLRLEEVSVRPVPLDQLVVVAELARHDLTDTTNGWTAGAAIEAFDAAVPSVDRGLTLAPSSNRSFGWWDVDTGVVAEPGKLYRGRFLVRASDTEGAHMPAFRFRLNSSTFELASTNQIYPPAARTEVPDSMAQLYDVYLLMPAGAPPGITLRAAFDLLGFGNIHTDASVTLEQFILEELAPVE